MLDLTVPSEELGKRRGSDLLEGKRTIITLHARQHGVAVDELLDDEPAEADIDAAVDRLHAAGSIEYARERAEELTMSSKERLDVLPESETRALLADLADYLIHRRY